MVCIFVSIFGVSLLRRPTPPPKADEPQKRATRARFCEGRAKNAKESEVSRRAFAFASAFAAGHIAQRARGIPEISSVSCLSFCVCLLSRARDERRGNAVSECVCVCVCVCDRVVAESVGLQGQSDMRARQLDEKTSVVEVKLRKLGLPQSRARLHAKSSRLIKSASGASLHAPSTWPASYAKADADALHSRASRRRTLGGPILLRSLCLSTLALLRKRGTVCRLSLSLSLQGAFRAGFSPSCDVPRTRERYQENERSRDREIKRSRDQEKEIKRERDQEIKRSRDRKIKRDVM